MNAKMKNKVETISTYRTGVNKICKIWKNMRNMHLNVEELKSDFLFW